MKKNKIIYPLICILILFVLLYVSYTITWKDYQNKHLMIYHPTVEESFVLSQNWGISSPDDLVVSSFIFQEHHFDTNAQYTLQYSNIEDITHFFTYNVHLTESFEYNENIISIGDEIYSFETITDYFGIPKEGCRFRILVDFERKKNNGEEDIQYVSFSVIKEETGFFTIECGMMHYGNIIIDGYDIEVSDIFKKHYWEDYIFKFLFT